MQGRRPGARQWFTGATRWIDHIEAEFPGLVIDSKETMRAAMAYLWMQSMDGSRHSIAFTVSGVAFLTATTQQNIREIESGALEKLAECVIEH